MSVHNTEVHRCRWCNELVAVAPDGFTLSPAALRKLAADHARGCTATLEGATEDA